MNEFEKEFSEELKGLDFLQKKKLEYEFNRWKNGLGRKIKLIDTELYQGKGKETLGGKHGRGKEKLHHV